MEPRINWKELTNNELVEQLKSANKRAEELENRIKELEKQLRTQQSASFLSRATANEKVKDDLDTSYEEYSAKFDSLISKGAKDISKLTKNEYRDTYEEYKITHRGKVLHGDELTESILDVRAASVKELTASYQNLMNHYQKGGADILSNVIDKYIADGNVLPTLDEWILTGGGTLYTYLTNAGTSLRDYALGS